MLPRFADLLMRSIRSMPYPAVLVGLYEEPERPANAVDYIKRYMGAPTGIDVEAIKAENARLKLENKELRTQIEEASAAAEEDNE